MASRKHVAHQKPSPQQIKPLPATEIIDNSAEKPKSSNQGDNTTKIQREPYHIVIEQKSDGHTKTIAIVSIIVNVILVAVTFLLYKQASIQSKATVGYLNETQKEFEVSNRAYLEVGEFDTAKSSKYLKISFKISNVGKQTVRIINAKWRSTIGPPPDTNTNTYKSPVVQYILEDLPKIPFVTDNRYVVFGSPSPMIQGYNMFAKNYIDGFKSGKYDFYLGGEMLYINLATNKLSTFRFVSEFSLRENKYYNILFEENKDSN